MEWFTVFALALCAVPVAAIRISHRRWFALPILGWATASVAALARWAAVVGFGIAAGLFLFEQWWQAVVGTVLSWWVWRAVPAPLQAKPRVNPLETGARLRVFSANLLFTNPTGGSGVAEEILSADPDVVVLIEAHPEATAGMGAVFASYPYRVSRDEGESRAVLLLSKVPWVNPQVLDSNGPRPYPSGCVRVGGMLVRVVAVHLDAPVNRERADGWIRSLANLSTVLEELTEPLVLVGDFNATPAHGPFRAMLRSAGLVDVTAGLGTWPVNGHPVPIWPLLFPGRATLALDHVLVRGMDPIATRTGIGSGSDHAPLLTELVVGTRGSAGH